MPRSLLFVTFLITATLILAVNPSCQTQEVQNATPATKPTTTKPVTKPAVDYFRAPTDGLLAVTEVDPRTNNPIKSGYVNHQGKLVIACQFQWAGQFKDGMARVTYGEDAFKAKYGFINTTGEFVVPPTYDALGEFGSAGLASFVVGKKWGFMNRAGETVIDPQYENVVTDFSEGLCAVELNGKVGFIDKTGKMVIEPQFNPSSVGIFVGGLATVGVRGTKNGPFITGQKFGVIDKSGKFVIEPKYDQLVEFREQDLTNVCLDGKWGFIDQKGNVVIPIRSTEATRFGGGMAGVLDPVTHKWGFIDQTGKFVIEPKYDAINPGWNLRGLLPFAWGDDLMPVCPDKKTGLWGYIDRSGKEVIAPRFHRAENFRCGLATVQIEPNGKFGCIDKTGKIVIEPKYDEPLGFFDPGVAYARVARNTYILIDKTGKTLWAPAED